MSSALVSSKSWLLLWQSVESGISIATRIAAWRFCPSSITVIQADEIVSWLFLGEEGRLEISLHMPSSSSLSMAAGIFPLLPMLCKITIALSMKVDSVMSGTIMLASTNDKAARNVISTLKNKNVSVQVQIESYLDVTQNLPKVFC